MNSAQFPLTCAIQVGGIPPDKLEQLHQKLSYKYYKAIIAFDFDAHKVPEQAELSETAAQSKQHLFLQLRRLRINASAPFAAGGSD
ncbi:hypothetical protein [Cohnella sp. 56]|uniref:hypothetical protein n=1 Tax=Cohnella sp. 56 TaxID=3113722 RepID=UPI0030E9AE0F